MPIRLICTLVHVGKKDSDIGVQIDVEKSDECSHEIEMLKYLRDSIVKAYQEKIPQAQLIKGSMEIEVIDLGEMTFPNITPQNII